MSNNLGQLLTRKIKHRSNSFSELRRNTNKEVSIKGTSTHTINKSTSPVTPKTTFAKNSYHNPIDVSLYRSAVLYKAPGIRNEPV